MIQSLAACVGGGFPDGLGEGARENQPCTPASTDSFQQTIGDEAVRQGLESIRQRDIPAHRIQHQKMSRVVEPHFLLTHPLQIGEKGGVLNHAVKGELELVRGGVRRGELLGTGNGVLKDEVHALTGAFYHPAALEDFGKTTIPRGLTIEQCFHGNLWQQTAGTLDSERGRGVMDEDAVSQQIVPVANGIEQRFPNRTLGERWQLPDEETRLEGLPGVAAGFVDLLPEEVVPREEALLNLSAQIRRARSRGVPILINQLSLGHVFAHRLSRAEENQGCMNQGAIGQKQLGVVKHLFMAETFDALCVALARFLPPRPQ